MAVMPKMATKPQTAVMPKMAVKPHMAIMPGRLQEPKKYIYIASLVETIHITGYFSFNTIY
jgi:hypothetical protein